MNNLFFGEQDALAHSFNIAFELFSDFPADTDLKPGMDCEPGVELAQI